MFCFGQARIASQFNLSNFLQKLTPCTGEDAEELHDSLKQSKLKVKGFGIDPNSREAVTVVVSSFTGKLGNWLPTMPTRSSS